MRISRNQGKREYETRRTVTWERDALALNGFHEHVRRSSRYLLVCLTRKRNLVGNAHFLEVTSTITLHFHIQAIILTPNSLLKQCMGNISTGMHSKSILWPQCCMRMSHIPYLLRMPIFYYKRCCHIHRRACNGVLVTITSPPYRLLPFWM